MEHLWDAKEAVKPTAHLECENSTRPIRQRLRELEFMEVKSGSGLAKIEPKRKPIKYSRGGPQRRRGSRV